MSSSLFDPMPSFSNIFNSPPAESVIIIFIFLSNNFILIITSLIMNNACILYDYVSMSNLCKPNTQLMLWKSWVRLPRLWSLTGNHWPQPTRDMTVSHMRELSNWPVEGLVSDSTLAYAWSLPQLLKVDESRKDTSCWCNVKP